MKANVGSSDKIVRILAAIVVVGLYFAGMITGTLAVVLLISAAVLTLTAFVSFCPLYFLMGINSCKIESKKSKL